MEFVKGGGAADEWNGMNQRNQKLMHELFKKGGTKVNFGREIGVKMCEWSE